MNLDLVRLCVPGTERNPFTNRCNRKCKKGNERIRLDQTKTYRCYKTCVKPKKRNTQTNRCNKGSNKTSSKATSPRYNSTRPSHKKDSKSPTNRKKGSKSRSTSFKLWGEDSRSNSYRY